MAKENNKSSMLSLLLILLLVLAGVFWLKPNWDEASALSVTMQARENTKSTLEGNLKKLQDAQTAVDQGTEINRETILNAIPERFQQDQLINEITDIAKKYDVSMSSISFAIPVGSTEQIKKATINVSMTGSEGHLLSFLKAVESSARKLLIKSITVQYGSTSGLERVNFNISMETYYQSGL